MNTNYRHWAMPVGGVLLLAATVHAGENSGIYLDSTNRLTLSARFGLNISGKFKGVSSAFSSGVPLAAGRLTPDGNPYNYDNGYVLPKYGGSNPQYPYTWNWGYDDASQVNPGAQTVSFDRTIATGLPSENSGGSSSCVGAELAYNHEFGVKEDWHHLRYGLEAAVNFMPISFSSGGLYDATLSRATDTYSYTSLTTPPGYTDPSLLPYQGTFYGPGFVIGDSPSAPSVTTTIPGATFLAQQHFDANLWGFRLGPYLEYPFSEKWSLHLSGGLAVGLLDADVNWQETLTLPGGAASRSASGSGSDTDLLWGGYVSANMSWQLSDRWSVSGGVQYQNLGTYQQSFNSQQVELDLRNSIFVTLGIGYSF